MLRFAIVVLVMAPVTMLAGGAVPPVVLGVATGLAMCMTALRLERMPAKKSAKQ